MGRFPAADPASDQWLLRAGNGHAAGGSERNRHFLPLPRIGGTVCADLQKVSGVCQRLEPFGNGAQKNRHLALKAG